MTAMKNTMHVIMPLADVRCGLWINVGWKVSANVESGSDDDGQW
jgi:hypothetical protein